MKKILLYILFLIFGCAYIHARFERSVIIYFPKNGYELVLDFRTNREAVALMLDSLNSSSSNDSTYRISSITFSGAASPDGSVAYNNKLAERRARSVFKYIASEAVLPDTIYAAKSIGRDWSGLFQLAKEDPDLPNRDYVLELLYRIANDSTIITGSADPLLKLKEAKGGSVYKYMYDNYFPLLRATHIDVSFEKISKSDYDSLNANKRVLEDVVFVDVEKPVAVIELAPVDTVPVDTVPIDTIPEVIPVDTIPVDTVPEVIPVDTIVEVAPVDTVVEEAPVDSLLCRPFYMAIKSNMLFDAAMTPNAGIEFYLGAGFSLSANWQYAWWKKDKTAFYWRTYGGDLEARYWFGKKAKEKPLTGHHVGLYGQMFTYAFEFGGKGILAPKWSWAAGASYGYSLPIHRLLNIDFVVGAGYHSGIYYEYIPVDGQYVWQATKRRHWLGPTKAEVTLVWLIGCDNYNRNPKFDKNKQAEIQATVDALVGEDKGGEQ